MAEQERYPETSEVEALPINGTAIIIVAMILLFLFMMGNRVIATYRDMTKLRTTPSFEDLIRTLELIMATEISIYERYMANTTDEVDLDGFINESQFNNIYHDLSTRVIKLLSPQFYEYMEVYWTEEEIDVYISQRIYTYLAEKAVPMGESEEEEGELEEEDEGDKEQSFLI